MASQEDGEEKLVKYQAGDKKLDSKDDIADLLKEINECEGLTALQLNGNSYGVEAMEAIGEALANKPLLSRAIWYDMFVSRLRSEIPPSLTALGNGVMKAEAHLTELDLSDNAFGPDGLKAVTALLTSPSCFSLKVLKFNNNGLGSKGGNILSKALLECHDVAQGSGQKLGLEVFVAGRNRLENDGATALAEVFETIGTLVHVSMPQNGINQEGVCALAKAFSSNPKLEEIDLNDNTFTEDGSVAMAEVLPNLQELRIINFGDCLVRPGGAKAIAEAIKDGHPLLQELNLSYGELDPESALQVVEALSNKKEIQKIELNGNAFGEDGIELLRESLEAKGLIDHLGSLSDDEELDTEEEEEEEEGAEKEGEEGEKVEEGSESGGGGGGGEKDSTIEEEEEVKADISSTEEQRDTVPVSNMDDESSKIEQNTISLEEYLDAPSAENLLALGDNRAEIIAESVHVAQTSSSGSQAGDTLCEESVALLFKVASLYTTVSACHVDGCDAQVESAVEQTADALLQPLCEKGLVNLVINQLLVHIGLIKSEDKKFKPVKEVEGPLLTLKHVVRQDYFPRSSADIFIAFLLKPNPILDPLRGNGTVQQVLQVLHTL